jgi:hypothetical protein
VATNYYVDEQGRVYSGSVATATSHSTLPFVAPAAAAIINSTPTVLATINDKLLNTAIAAGTQSGPIKKMH